MGFDSEIKTEDKLLIFLRTGVKALRGLWKRLFIKEVNGLCLHGLNFEDVTIGRNVMIRLSSYYGGDCRYGLTIGNNSSIEPHGYIGCSGSISIGNNVMIGPKCSLFAENYVFSDDSATIKSQGVTPIEIRIGNDCWIGGNVIILDGVTIGDHVVIGAGTLITPDVPSDSVVLDNRQKSVRLRDGEK